MKYSIKIPSRLTWVGLSICVLSAGSASASDLQALAGAVGGQSTCTTFGTRPPIGPLFGAVFDTGNIGNGISDCGLQGSIQNNTVANGSVTAANTVSAIVGGGPYTGSSSATSQYGTLSVAAHGDMQGTSNTLGFSQSGGFSIFNDQLTFMSPTQPSGSPGSVIYTFTVGGALTTPGPNPPYTAQNLGELVLQQGGSPGSIFTANTYTGSPGTILGSSSYPGFTSSAGSIQGSGQFSSGHLPFTWGTVADLTAGLAAVSFPATGSTLDAHLKAVLSGITVYDAAGNPVTIFNINAASGSIYTAAGVVVAPLPAAGWLFSAGLLGLMGIARRKAG